MEFEFDKEIDAILRKARDGESAFATTDNAPSAIRNPQSPHLDADEISAFAENALPEKAKTLYTAHLADCARCRKILSNLISLESEAETVAASSAVKAEIVEAKIPWYRRIFAMPNLAYTMGALALLFSGLTAFVVLQSSFRKAAEVSQISEKPSDTKSASSAPMMSNANMSMNTNSANTSMNTNSTANSASVYSSNITTANSSANVSSASPAANTAAGKPMASATAIPKEEPIREADKDLAKTDTRPVTVTTEDAARAENKPVTENRTRSDDEVLTKLAPKSNAAQPSMDAKIESRQDQKEKKSSSETATTNVGGKTFRRANNVWYDTAYNNQPTTNILRRTSEYKKLDSGLRSIADNLGGTVVIVWKNKAYRIQ